MNEVEAVSLSSSWFFSPTLILFCILNLTIATIYILKKHDQHLHDPPQLIRVPSIFERVRSFNLNAYRSDPLPDPAQPEPDSTEEIIVSHVTRSVPDAEKVLKRRTSEKLSATGEAEVRDKTTSLGGDDHEADEVDAKADDFINRFRQQLKLQRLDSILRYKEMLNRGILGR